MEMSRLGNQVVFDSARASNPANQGLIVTAVIAFITAVLWIPISVTLTLVMIVGLVFTIKKFHHDNLDLIIGDDGERLADSAGKGFMLFLPVIAVLIPAFLLALFVDFILGTGVDWLSALSADKTSIVKRPEFYDLPWYNVYGWLGNKGTRWVEDVQTVKASLMIRATVGATKNFLNLLSAYTWLFIGFITLRCYCFFWARVFVTKGGQVTMQLPKYRR